MQNKVGQMTNSLFIVSYFLKGSLELFMWIILEDILEKPQENLNIIIICVF